MLSRARAPEESPPRARQRQWPELLRDAGSFDRLLTLIACARTIFTARSAEGNLWERSDHSPRRPSGAIPEHWRKPRGCFDEENGSGQCTSHLSAAATIPSSDIPEAGARLG